MALLTFLVLMKKKTSLKLSKFLIRTLRRTSGSTVTMTGLTPSYLPYVLVPIRLNLSRYTWNQLTSSTCSYYDRPGYDHVGEH